MTVRSVTAAAILLAAGLTWTTTGAQSPADNAFNERLLQAFSYRNVGPFRMGARTSDIAVPALPAKAHLYTFYVAFWTGGVWKTTNNGTTFEPVFDAQRKLTIGDVTVAPSNADIVWVGTGDGFTSRSSYAGDGVYKSTDAGKTWKNMGLKDSHHIARIVIHPTNPDIVYVAAMGHLFSENDERGVFRTTDGGATWEKVLYVSPKVGVIDLVMNPKDPAVLYAATYEKERLPWQIVNGGPGSGIYKTTDAARPGRSWAADSRADASAASVSTSTWRTRTSSTRSSRIRTNRRAPGGSRRRRVAVVEPGSCRPSAARSIARQTAARPGRR